MKSDKHGDTAVDDILEELKSRGVTPESDGKIHHVDVILAEMGMGVKKPSPFDHVRPGAPMPPPSRTDASPAQASKPAPQETDTEMDSSPEAPAPPVSEEEQFEAEEYFYQPEETQDEPPAPPKRNKTGTMIWDIEVERTDVGPLMGKAAALDRVETDKYVGDSELSRWFDKDSTMAFSKKERKQAEKELRRRLAEEEKEKKQKTGWKAEHSAVAEPEETQDTYQEEIIYQEEILVEEETYVSRRENVFADGYDEAPEEETDYGDQEDFYEEKPRKKGLFSRLFSRKNKQEDDYYNDPNLDDVWNEEASDWQQEVPAALQEPDEGDAFTSAFGDGNTPKVRPQKPKRASVKDPVLSNTASFSTSFRKKVPKESAVPADTAAFTAAYLKQAAEEKTDPADTAAFSTAMQPGDDSHPEDAYQHAFAAALNKSGQQRAKQPAIAPDAGGAEPDTAEFAAALGKGPITKWPAGDGPKKQPAKASGAWGDDRSADSQSAFDETSVWEKTEGRWDEESSFFDAGTATVTFDAQIAERRTAAFAAIRPEDLEPATEPPRSDTKSFDIEKDEEAQRVPTAAFTQEFGMGGEGTPEERSLFVDEMVDDRFRQFFSETVIVERSDPQHDTKSRKRRKKSRSAVLTGEFARMAEMAEQAEMAELAGEEYSEEDGFDDYDSPQDAPAIEGDIAALRTTLTRRAVASAIISLLLIWMSLSFTGTLPLPKAMSFNANPIVFTIVYLALIMAAVVINFTTVATGLAGLFTAPTVDSAPALAALGGILQGAFLLVQVINKQPAEATLFGGLAVLVLCFNALGKRVRAVSILHNFQLASAGMDHSAAYILDSSNELSYNITKGLEEEDPTLLVSRPTTLVKGFLRQSFSQRATDRTGRTLGWITLGAGLAATALSLFIGGYNIFSAVSAFAAVLCIASPFSSSLVSGIPSLLLQRSTARIGAVVPGWSAIEELGNVNVVMATARDIFPPSSVCLKGIKTFQKERIDSAILYAASVLIEGCDTLRDIFSGVIQGKNDMLYKVESLVQEPGRGFTAWVQNNRVVIGSREMLQKHDVVPPPIEIEVKYVPEGHMPVYLAVSGKLFAMFIIGYRADPEVRETLNGLVKSGVSLLVHSNDMNVTGELIEYAYRLPHGVVKVLGRRELAILEPLTTYTPESDGVMTHIGSFASFIGGMRYAAGCAASERMSSVVQVASVILAGALCLLLAFGGSLATLSIGLALLYQAAWTLLVSILPFVRRY